ncbi:hypothetical protein CDAR_93131 [Caerostris darwini]|uniref:Uncharacterized protein n=1 Tax=Caerostris darwini TaxID=1538125 RepID=A0AAV4VNF5_9ARAC|nr:hypothetical protein CDAR_93131 [Caerostris darwini]
MAAVNEFGGIVTKKFKPLQIVRSHVTRMPAQYRQTSLAYGLSGYDMRCLGLRNMAAKEFYRPRAIIGCYGASALPYNTIRWSTGSTDMRCLGLRNLAAK